MNGVLDLKLRSPKHKLRANLSKLRYYYLVIVKELAPD
jgi:hypothetical protein